MDFHEEFEILMPNDTKSIQNRQFLGQCEFPLEKKKKISDFDKKSGSDGVGSSSGRRVVVLYFFQLTLRSCNPPLSAALLRWPPSAGIICRMLKLSSVALFNPGVLFF